MLSAEGVFTGGRRSRLHLPGSLMVPVPIRPMAMPETLVRVGGQSIQPGRTARRQRAAFVFRAFNPMAAVEKAAVLSPLRYQNARWRWLYAVVLWIIASVPAQFAS